MRKYGLFLLFLVPFLGYSQKVIEKVKLSDGRVIVVNDDYTWRYENNSNISTSQVYGVSSVTNSSDNVVSNRYIKGSNKKQNNSRKKNSSTSNSSYRASYSGYCGALTKSGGSCRRRVFGGGRCWQH